MFGLSRKERLAASLEDGEAALVASRFEDAHAAFSHAAQLAEDLDARDAQGRALLAAAKAALAQGDGDRAAYLAAEAVVTLELAGAASTAAFDVLSASSSSPVAVTVERALDVARKHARNDDHPALITTGDAL